MASRAPGAARFHSRMMSLGNLNTSFDVRSKVMEVTFDPASQQQFLSFNLLLQVSIPQLLQELLNFQCSDGGLPGPTSNPEVSASRRPAVHPQRQQIAGTATPAVGSSAPAGLPSKAGPMRPLAQSRPCLEFVAAPKAGFPMPGVVSAGLAGAVPQAKAPANSSDLNQRSMEVQPAEKLIQAVLTGDVAAAKEAIRQGADATRLVAGPRQHSLVHAALEAGGRLDMLSLLLQARCDVNEPAADGRTPLHVAIAQHAVLSPMVARLLLSSRASLTAPDAGQVTPLDCVRVLAKQSASAPSSSVRQLLDEVSERPTVSVTVVKDEQVFGACFADTANDKIIFCTETAIELYSIEQRCVFWKQKLTQLRVQSVVRGMAVNPVVGTIAVFLEAKNEATNTGQADNKAANTGQADNNKVQNLIIIWPTGQLQEEEPLKLSAAESATATDGDTLPPAIMLSTLHAPLAVLSRVCSGKVLCWRLNATASQIVSETKITDRGGIIALADNARWLAVRDCSEMGTKQVEVWTFAGPDNTLMRAPKRIACIDRRPQSMAIISQGEAASCLIALAEEPSPGCPIPPIEVLQVLADGSANRAYRARPESPCRLLSFCHESPDFLLSGHDDGLVIVYNLPLGQLRLSHDDVGIRSICISVDRTLIVTSVGECFRVYRVPPETSTRSRIGF